LGLLSLASPGWTAEASFNVEVPPGQWKGLKVKNLPAKVVVGVEIESSGRVDVFFVPDAGDDSKPGLERAIFRGRVDRRLSFSVTIPESDHYLVVLDNREGDDPRDVQLTVRAAQDHADVSAAPPEFRADAESLAEAEAKLLEFRTGLGEIFVFESFDMRVKKCGRPGAFTSSEGIVLCQEYAQLLYEKLGDKQKASDTLVFTLFHESGHILLEQWKYPFYENEEVVDEFAVALMTMLGHRERVHAAAEFFSANSSVSEVLEKSMKDDRHPISAQRARNLQRWAGDPKIVSKWQGLFVPQLRTDVLEKLNDEPMAWTDPALVQKELRARR
jgi:hypothetical protein